MGITKPIRETYKKYSPKILGRLCGLAKGIPVAILHPGLVSTRMTGFTSSGIQPNESVKGMIQRIDELTLENTGTFWHSNGNILPW